MPPILIHTIEHSSAIVPHNPRIVLLIFVKDASAILSLDFQHVAVVGSGRRRCVYLDQINISDTDFLFNTDACSTFSFHLLRRIYDS